jgi:hypothetical protein
MIVRIGGKMRRKIGFVAGSAAGLLFALQAVPAARAQVTLDLSKITCGQYTGHKLPIRKISQSGSAAITTGSAVIRPSTPKG